MLRTLERYQRISELKKQTQPPKTMRNAVGTPERYQRISGFGGVVKNP